MGANSNFGFGSGSGWPFIAASFGLGSNESTCEIPPCMNRNTTRFARAGKWGGLAASGEPVGPAARAMPGTCALARRPRSAV